MMNNENDVINNFVWVLIFFFFLVPTDERDPVVAYWCRLYGLQTGLKLSTKQQDETALFIGINLVAFYSIQ